MALAPDDGAVVLVDEEVLGGVVGCGGFGVEAVEGLVHFLGIFGGVCFHDCFVFATDSGCCYSCCLVGRKSVGAKCGPRLMVISLLER